MRPFLCSLRASPGLYEIVALEPNNPSNRLMVRYNWQLKNWPNFEYSLQDIEDEMFLLAEKTGKVTGILNALPEAIQMEAVVDIMVAEAINTSEIEGEYL